jgi:hypothetical protein
MAEACHEQERGGNYPAMGYVVLEEQKAWKVLCEVRGYQSLQGAGEAPEVSDLDEQLLAQDESGGGDEDGGVAELEWKRICEVCAGGV